MMNFCTLFDSYYIHKGIALYLSLERQTQDFHLYVMAFDKDCYDKLNAIGFDKMTVERVDAFETPELLAVKPTRTKAEYCWTCGPSVIWHFLNKYHLPELTYLDSDLFFMGDPHLLFDEIGDRSIAITEQRASKKEEKLFGKYCVQFMYFKNDPQGREALSWWRDACIDWCFMRIENGLFADQKYLDQFPVRYQSLCVLENPGAGIAPWNMHRYTYADNRIRYKGKEYPCVFVHMHGLKMEVKGRSILMHSNDAVINHDDKAAYYNRYAEALRHVLKTYFGIETDSYSIEGIGFFRRIYFRLRSLLRDVGVVQWLYFKVFKTIYKGHGTKLS